MNIGQSKGRLGRMQWDEICTRTRQAILKRADWTVSRVGLDCANNQIEQTPTMPGKFFFSPESVNSILELIRQRLPCRAEHIIQEADQICGHQFDLLGHARLDYRNQKDSAIDWHHDAVHGKRAPGKAFYRIRYLDYDECGDSKVTWELNRHQHLVTLAKAFRLTGEPRYLNEILHQQRDWVCQNPYPIGINWASSLEVAFRSLSWLWVYHFICGTSGIPELRPEWLRGLTLHGRHIERYLSTYFSPNTHLLGEALALFFIGVLCSELAGAARWKALGWELMLRESERQILNDGFYFEQSTYYHVYALDMFLHAQVLATVNNIPVPQSFREKIEKMLTALCMLGRYGAPPRFGDDDGGRLFDARRNCSEHLLDPLAAGAILFHRGDFKAVAGGLREETLWLLGEEGVRQWDRLQAEPVASASCALPDAGYYMLTTGDSQLFVNAAPKPGQTGGHAHADALSICFQSHGTSLLIDPGTFEYVGPRNDRDLYRGTGMHNTVQIDGLDQAETASPFSWKKLTGSKVERWIQGQGFDFLMATHNGYRRLDSPVVHRRCVVSLKNGMFLVRDVIEGSGRHQIDIRWHLGHKAEPLDKYVFNVRGSDHGLALLPANNEGWTDGLLQQSWSPAYGRKAPMTVLKFSTTMELPTEFSVLLIALNDVRDGRQSFRRIECSQPGLAAYDCSVDERHYSFFFHDKGGSWRSDPLSSDAEFLCRELSPDTSERLILCRGTYASVDGGAELRGSRKVEWAEIVFHGSSHQVFSSDLPAIIQQPAPENLAGRVPVLSSRF